MKIRMKLRTEFFPQTKGPDTKAHVDNLEEGVTYQFRVKAINAAGPGEPSGESKQVTCKPRKRKIFLIYCTSFFNEP